MATKNPVIKSFSRQICQSSRLARELIILGVARGMRKMASGASRRERDLAALYRAASARFSRAIRHRIIRRQVRRGSQQLGKLEGVVFYFRDYVQRAPVPPLGLRSPSLSVSSTPFCGSLSPRQSFRTAFQSSFVNAAESETRRQMSRARLAPCRLLSPFFFLRASGCEQVVIILHASHVRIMHWTRS